MTETRGSLSHQGAKLAWRRVPGRPPTILWLGGFGSDMTGTKASALGLWAVRGGHDFLAFDYFGHGASEGDFEHGTITRWRGDVLAVVDEMTEGPVVFVGSSMGGWLACLVALARPDRVRGLVLVAPAADFTDKLLAPGLPPEGRAAIISDGVWRRSFAGETGLPITRALLEDGARWSILPGPTPVTAPVRVLQGGADTEVPWTHALELANAFVSEDVVFTLICAGDHRLSRPEDIARLITAIEDVA